MIFYSATISKTSNGEYMVIITRKWVRLGLKNKEMRDETYAYFSEFTDALEFLRNKGITNVTENF